MKSTVGVVHDYLRGKVSWCPALVSHEIPFLSYSRYSKVTQFHIPFLSEEYVVQLDVPMSHRPAMQVSQADDDLLKYVLGLFLEHLPLSFYNIQ